MADRITLEERSAVMRAVRAKDTKPELVVRRLLHRLGYRFRLHAPDLPGRPDLVFRKQRVAVFVHGCFWHSHQCRKGRQRPLTNAARWQAKLDRNVERDREVTRELEAQGWTVVTVWECEPPEEGVGRVRRALRPSRSVD